MEVDKDVMVSQVGDLGFLIELKAVKATLALDVPLLGGRWCHCVYRKLWSGISE